MEVHMYNGSSFPNKNSIFCNCKIFSVLIAVELSSIYGRMEVGTSTCMWMYYHTKTG